MLKNFILFCSLLCFITCAYKGIDVSVWQGSNVDFKKVKADGKSFVIMRAGIGTNVDKYYESNYKKAKAAGMNVGAYWYCKALTVKASTNEANKALSALKGKKFEYPIYYDIENANLFAKGKTLTSKIAENFCSIMEKHGYFCGIYASKSFLDSYFTDTVKKKYTIWVAQYNSKCTYKGTYKIWQRSSKGKVSGISGNVDLDESYCDFPSIVKNKHLNGF